MSNKKSQQLRNEVEKRAFPKVDEIIPGTVEFIQRKVDQEQVIETYLKNQDIKTTAIELGVSQSKVKAIVSKGAVKQQALAISERVYLEAIKDKLPLLQDIMGCSLSILQQKLYYLEKDKEAIRGLSMGEAKQLSEIGKSFNEMMRLETGQSTENLEIRKHNFNYDKSNRLVEKLSEVRKVDSIFNYPDKIEIVDDPEIEADNDETF